MVKVHGEGVCIKNFVPALPYAVRQNKLSNAIFISAYQHLNTPILQAYQYKINACFIGIYFQRLLCLCLFIVKFKLTKFWLLGKLSAKIFKDRWTAYSLFIIDEISISNIHRTRARCDEMRRDAQDASEMRPQKIMFMKSVNDEELNGS